MALLVLLPSAAHALDEAQIVGVSCDGLRVTQRGLPPGLALEVAVINGPTGVHLAEVDVTSTAAGGIDVPVAVNLRAVRQVVVDVERRSDGNEYGEVGADLPQPCTSRPTRPAVRAPVSAPRAATPAAAGHPTTPSTARPALLTPESGAFPSPAQTGSRRPAGAHHPMTVVVLGSLAIVAGLVLAGAVLARGRRRASV